MNGNINVSKWLRAKHKKRAGHKQGSVERGNEGRKSITKEGTWCPYVSVNNSCQRPPARFSHTVVSGREISGVEDMDVGGCESHRRRRGGSIGGAFGEGMGSDGATVFV